MEMTGIFYNKGREGVLSPGSLLLAEKNKEKEQLKEDAAQLSAAECFQRLATLQPGGRPVFPIIFGLIPAGKFLSASCWLCRFPGSLSKLKEISYSGGCIILDVEFGTEKETFYHADYTRKTGNR